MHIHDHRLGVGQDYKVDLQGSQDSLWRLATFSRGQQTACLSVCLVGIAWKGSNPGYVLTSGKDSCLCLHEFSSADEPLNKVSPVAVSIGPSGRVAHAFNNKLAQSTG